MIPVTDREIILYDVDVEQDKKYKDIIREEIIFFTEY
mgnify:FL=1